MFDSSIIQLSPSSIGHSAEGDLQNSFRQTVSRLMQDRNDEETVLSIEGYSLFFDPIPEDVQSNVEPTDDPWADEEVVRKLSANSSERKEFLKKVDLIASKHLSKIVAFFLKKAKTSIQLVYQEMHSLRHSIFNAVDYDAAIYVSTSVQRDGQRKNVKTALSVVTTSAEFYLMVKKFCDKHIIDLAQGQSASQSKVYLLSKDSNRYFFNSFSLQPHPFLSCGFSQKNQDFFGGIVDKIATKKPFGRIHIFHGPPGTGKTSFIKSVITETLKKYASSRSAHFFDSRKICFIYIPVSSFSFFSSPEAIGTLLDEGFSETSRIVFIIEDADNLIKKRDYDGNDKDTLSNLLNFCDGITGQIFDVQCLVTSNIASEKIDPAFVRPGRLGSLVIFDPLDGEEKKQFCDQFKIEEPQGPRTLAELFEIVNEKQFVLNHSAISQDDAQNKVLHGMETPAIMKPSAGSGDPSQKKSKPKSKKKKESNEDRKE